MLTARAAGCHFRALRHLELLLGFVCSSLIISPCPRLASRSSPLLSDRTVCSGHVGWSVLFWRTSCFEADPTCNFLLQRNLFELGIYERVVCAKTHPMLQSAPSKRCSDTKSLERDWTLWYKDTNIISIIVHMHTQVVENRHKAKYWIPKTVFRCC